MKRRELVLGLGALAGTVPVVSALGISVAQASVAGFDKRVLAPILPAAMLRIDLITLQFADSIGALGVDVLCNVDGKLLPYRIAFFRADVVSPQSKAFGFELDQRALAGFRIEHCKSGRTTTVALGSCNAGFETAYTAPADGTYVLDINAAGMGAVVSQLRSGQRLDDPSWLARRQGQSYLVFKVGRL